MSQSLSLKRPLVLFVEPCAGGTCRAPWFIKFGNLSMQEILVVTLAYVCMFAFTYAHTDSWGGGGETGKEEKGVPRMHYWPMSALIIFNGVFSETK